jgi:hypothetical protein
MDIQTLRKMRNNDFGKITSEFEKIKNPQSGERSYEDDRFWKLEADKAGNASATIRFLPKVEGDELPWVQLFSHAFQGPTGKWYIENSLTTIEQNDPVGELNRKLWNSGSEANKKIAQKQKRKLQYIANILVVSDPKHPENEGKVFLFKFGKKIFEKIMDKASPTFEDEKPVNVFDLWEGADFKLRMRKVDGFPNYDQSTFPEPSTLFDGDEEKLVEVINKQVSLKEFNDSNNRKLFKTYEQLQKRLNEVLGGDEVGSRSASQEAEEEPALDFKPTKTAAPKMESKPSKVTAAVEDDEEDVMSYFEKLARD